MGGPSLETATGHQLMNSSSPLTKGKARPLLQLPVITTHKKHVLLKRCASGQRKPPDNLRLGLTIVESLQ